MYFGLQDTKPPPCPLHLTKQGGSIHWSKVYLCTVCKLVLYISGDHNYALYCYEKQKQFMNKAYISHSRLCLCVAFFRGNVCYKSFSWPCARLSSFYFLIFILLVCPNPADGTRVRNELFMTAPISSCVLFFNFRRKMG